MDGLIALIAIGLLIGWGFYLAKYARLLKSIVDYSNENNVELFGARYRDLYHLYADIGFLNTLWKKDCHSQVDDSNLSMLVFRAHRMLRTQMTIGVFLFAIPLVNAFVKANA